MAEFTIVIFTHYKSRIANCCRNSRLVVDEDDLKWVAMEKNIVIFKTVLWNVVENMLFMISRVNKIVVNCPNLGTSA